MKERGDGQRVFSKSYEPSPTHALCFILELRMFAKTLPSSKLFRVFGTILRYLGHITSLTHALVKLKRGAV
jgi:hypothetical protein